MKSYVSVCALALVVGACSSGNPFDLLTTPPATTPAETRAADVQGAFPPFTSNKVSGDLTITGVTVDGDAATPVL